MWQNHATSIKKTDQFVWASLPWLPLQTLCRLQSILYCGYHGRDESAISVSPVAISNKYGWAAGRFPLETGSPCERTRPACLGELHIWLSFLPISTSNILQTFILLYPYCPYMSLPFLSFKHLFEAGTPCRLSLPQLRSRKKSGHLIST